MTALVGKAELARILRWSRPKLDRRIEYDGRRFPVVTRGTQAGGWQFDVAAVQAYLAGEDGARVTPTTSRDPDEPDTADIPTLVNEFGIALFDLETFLATIGREFKHQCDSAPHNAGPGLQAFWRNRISMINRATARCQWAFQRYFYGE